MNFANTFVINPENNPGDDFNKNGITSETRLDQIVRSVGITVITEAGVPDPARPNMEHSDFNTDPPVVYPFRDYKVSIEINPANLSHEGAPLLKVTPPTPTVIPVTFTPTPIPPTAPPGEPTYTPLATETPPPDTTPSPTPTPGYSDYNDDEIIIGSDNGFLAVSLDYDQYNPATMCIDHGKQWYWIEYAASIVEMEAVNFCDPLTSPDNWNDLIYVTDDTFYDNVVYMKHLPYQGIDNGLVKQSSLRVDSGGTNQYIVAMTVGNIDPDPGQMYPEILVAYYDPDSMHSFINYVRITGQCGSLLPPACYPFSIPGQITDMVMGDFDYDLVDELAVTIRPMDDEATTPQLIILNNLADCYQGTWDVMYDNSSLFPQGDFPVSIDDGIFVGPDDIYLDLVTVSSLGTIAVIPNNGLPNYFEIMPCLPPLPAHAPAKALASYPFVNPGPLDIFNRFAVISAVTDWTLQNYKSNGFCEEITMIEGAGQCSGPFTIDGSRINPIDIEWLEVYRNALGTNLGILATILDNRTLSSYQLAIMANPCYVNFPSELCFIDLGINPYHCLTSTRNAYTNQYQWPQREGKKDSPSLKPYNPASNQAGAYKSPGLSYSQGPPAGKSSKGSLLKATH